MDNKAGRPQISELQKTEMVRKLEPYLKSGVNLKKALLETKIPRSTFYDLMNKDKEFSDKIEGFKQFLSIMVNSAIVKQLQTIVEKQNDGEELTKSDIKFLQWFALNSNLTIGEYGRREKVDLYDPEAEIQRVKKEIESWSASAPHSEPS